MNKLLDQYILKKFAANFLIIISSFTIIFIIVDIIDNLDNHISIHVGDSSGGHRCEGNLKNDKILYTK